MLYELRRYQIEPGRRDEWVALMERRIIPFQSSQGMDILGSFTDEQNPDVYIWIRRFESEEQRVQQYAAVYESDTWANEIAPVAGQLLLQENITVTRLVPTPISGLR
jgi:NIPSNAP